MDRYIEISGIIDTSLADGPGVRSVLFMQGCSKGCVNCHNKQAQQKGYGKNYRIDELIDYIKSICLNKKITISGGEPMEQYEELLELTKRLCKMQYDICIYTGLELEEIPEEILKYINYIKTGEFIDALKDSTLAFVGSSNQKMYKVNKEKELWMEQIEI